ncbi:hypothetical protein [Parapedobacter soli]|uniref:hypothetical protein n=1 Tax=Parapedobacter soli TaxID=416955 RepID=UPI0021C995DA|nr:hypothetical protein [Parapedobacter soli]
MQSSSTYTSGQMPGCERCIYTGLMALYAINPDTRYQACAAEWGEKYQWSAAYQAAKPDRVQIKKEIVAVIPTS